MSKGPMMRCALAVLALTMLLRTPAAAQSIIHDASELTERPQLVSPSKTADLIRAAYPAELKKNGVTGMVQIAFVIDEQGKVEPATVKVMNSTAPELADAALKIAPQFEFKPGKKDAKAVRTQVVLPVAFR